MKRLLVAVAAALAALAVAAPASAHDVTVSGTAECQTDGTYAITWTITNSESTPMTFTSDRPGVAGVVTGPSATFPDSAPGTSTSVSITVSASWPDGHPTNASATVELGGDCTATTTGGTTGETTGQTTGETTGATTGGGTTGGGTTGSGGVIGATTGGTTGGSPGAETGGELPFTGLPVWIPVLLAFALLGSGVFLLRRKRDDVS